MSSISICFRIQQPFRFRTFCFNDIGKIHSYEDKESMAMVMDNLADNCYLPANRVLLEQIIRSNGNFRIAFSISGTTLELFQQFRPGLIDSFRELVDTGCVEILGETYYDSFSWLHSIQEFDSQVKEHEELVRELFGYEPLVFRNTGFIHDNELAKHIAGLGYKGLLTNGVADVLNNRSPNQIYAAPGNGDFGLLLRNADLSEDIACWFGKAKGSRYALTAEKFAERVFHDHAGNSCAVNIFLDYETFGIHKTGKTGIFKFLEELPAAILSNKNWCFNLPTAVLEDCYPKDIYDVPQPISKYDDVSSGKSYCQCLQHNAMLKKIYKLQPMVYESADAQLLKTWRRLQSAELFSFIGGNHQQGMHAYRYADHAGYPVEQYQQMANILTDLEISLITAHVERNRGRFNHQFSTILF